MAEVPPDQLRLMAEALPDEVGFTDVSSGVDLTFGDWERCSNRLTRWLVGQGVVTGDRVAIHTGTWP